MVESNFQRSEILPSEKAFAYKMRYDAMKKSVGRPSNDKLVPVGLISETGATREAMAQTSLDSETQIQRSIRLTNLVPELLDFVDEKSEFMVDEISSYQCADFIGNPDLGILVALYSAHLPWHGTLERYHADKMNMIHQAKEQIDIRHLDFSVKEGFFYDTIRYSLINFY